MIVIYKENNISTEHIEHNYEWFVPRFLEIPDEIENFEFIKSYYNTIYAIIPNNEFKIKSLRKNKFYKKIEDLFDPSAFETDYHFYWLPKKLINYLVKQWKIKFKNDSCKLKIISKYLSENKINLVYDEIMIRNIIE